MAQEILTCEKHPTREATLRCIRCNRPMCPECVVPTPTGYICRECARRQEDRFYSVEALDYPKVFGIALVANLVACGLSLMLGFWYAAIFIGGGLGGAAGTFARRQTGRRVGRQSTAYAFGGAVLGALLAPMLYLLLSAGVLVLNPGLLFRIGGLTVIVCTVAFCVAIYSIYQRRI
jgi:hypothetical protein